MADLAELERRIIEIEAVIARDRTENKTMFEWIVGAFGRLDGSIEKLRTEVATKADVAAVKNDVAGLRRDLPGIIGDAVRPGAGP